MFTLSATNKLFFPICSGYVSFRNSEEGSWFIKELCKALNEHGFTLNILTVLTLVNLKVAVDYESYTPDKPFIHQKKQNPCISHMLTRLLRFSPKDKSDTTLDLSLS